MKTKLLRKVRRRYQITKFDELASNANEYIKEVEKELGLPFYLLEDTEHFLNPSKFCKTFEHAHKTLCEWIVRDYREQFRHKDEVSTKVWWVKK